jgi:hypothetical protein
MSDQVADVLDDAADWLETHEWIQGDLYVHNAALETIGACSVGILGYSAHPAAQKLAARDALAKQLDIAPESRGGVWLADWNDAPERTKQQVLDAFRAAAKAERMQPLDTRPVASPELRGGIGLPGDAPSSG